MPTIKKDPALEYLFEYASRDKLRFSSTKGFISVEDLWDVPLRSRDDFNLDTIARTANKAWKTLSEESFVNTDRTPEHIRREAALELVKYVIDVKLQEEQDALQRTENRAKKEKLLRILAEKQEGRLSDLSEKELQKQINALDT